MPGFCPHGYYQNPKNCPYRRCSSKPPRKHKYIAIQIEDDDSRAPLLEVIATQPLSEQQVLEEKIALAKQQFGFTEDSTYSQIFDKAKAKLTLDGRILFPSGATIDNAGFHLPTTYVSYGAWLKASAWSTSIALLGTLSGASGFPGAEKEHGVIGGMISWWGTSMLNMDGTFKLFARITSGHFSSLNKCILFVVVFIAIVAAIPPAVLAGTGAVELITSSHVLVQCMFAVINGIVSSALNVTSLLNILPGIQAYFDRAVAKDENGQRSFFRMFVMAIFFLIASYASLSTTIVRGRATFDWVKNLLGEAAGATVFGITGVVGFAMFLNGLLGLALMIVDIIKAVRDDIVKRTKQSFALDDSFIFIVALAIAGLAAYGAFINYEGLVKSSLEEDWPVRVVLTALSGGVDSLAEFPSSMTAAINLIQRVVSFRDYVGRFSSWIAGRPGRLSDAELNRQQNKIAESIAIKNFLEQKFNADLKNCVKQKIQDMRAGFHQAQVARAA